MQGVSDRSKRGALCILLHTHMPYVEGFGTWPFGEEWLWEAIATCYLPLLDLLDRGAPLTLSLTPVLCDQLQAPGISERFSAFVQQVRRHTHEEDAKGLRQGGYESLARELERSLLDYERASSRLAERGGDLLAAFAPHAQWTSSATHAVLPLLATEAGLRAQVETGIDAHRARFRDRWEGGFWLPECAHSREIEPALVDAGVRACCVELTNALGIGSFQHLRPLLSDSGLILVPIDRQTMSLVWSDGGYPAQGAYRDYHRHTVHHHNPWSNGGGGYDHGAALALSRRDAAHFVSQTKRRLTDAAERGIDQGLVVCALDTELLGHWWYEGVTWLTAVVEECSAQGVDLVRLDDALSRCDPQPVEGISWEASSWGSNGDLSTWSGPDVADIAFAQRACELRLLRKAQEASIEALRELLALQSSDWAFMVSRQQAMPYAKERFAGHLERFERALEEGAKGGKQELRNLAVHADVAPLSAP